jgi:hypothetical protein
MKKWEYMATQRAIPHCKAELDVLGFQGWECFAVISSTVGDVPTYFLKRELIDTKQVIL